jgi:hypothetical protein
MNNALARIVKTEKADAGRASVILERLRHGTLFGVCNRGQVAVVGWYIVVGARKCPLGHARRATACPQHRKGRRRAVLYQMPVDVEERLTVFALQHRVARPDAVKQSLRSRGRVHGGAM